MRQRRRREASRARDHGGWASAKSMAGGIGVGDWLRAVLASGIKSRAVVGRRVSRVVDMAARIILALPRIGRQASGRGTSWRGRRASYRRRRWARASAHALEALVNEGRLSEKGVTSWAAAWPRRAIMPAGILQGVPARQLYAF